MLNGKVLGALPWIYSLHWDSMIYGHHIYEDAYLDSFYGRNSSCAARSRQTSVLRKSKGLQLAIAKEITKGWFSQGDYNKLIHMFKACTQSNAAGAK